MSSCRRARNLLTHCVPDPDEGFELGTERSCRQTSILLKRCVAAVNCTLSEQGPTSDARVHCTASVGNDSPPQGGFKEGPGIQMEAWSGPYTDQQLQIQSHNWGVVC